MDFNVSNKKKKGSQKQAPSLDIEVAKMGLIPYEKEVKKIVEEAASIVVKDDETNKLAISLGGKIDRFIKEIKNKEKEVVEEPKAFVKGVSSFIKLFTTPLSEGKDTLKQKIGQYLYKVELERRKQEEEIRKANEKLQKKLDKEAEKSGVEAPQVSPVTLPKQKIIARTEETSAHTRKQWKAEIIDELKVPREYCMPDMKKINDAVRMGTREIEGVRIFEDISTVFRS
ncbi:MAG: hypothetical protein SV062_07415 [Thermodesulfobacteriota bacterium]|nr:hypothetical protein [Thermodesulfobacteriota bacterium]